MKSPCAGFIKSINPAKYQRTEDTDTEPASIQLKLVKFEPTPPVDTSSGSKWRHIETKEPVLPAIAERTSPIAAIATTTSGSPMSTQVPMPLPGKGGLANLRAMLKQYLHDRRGV